LVACVAAVFFPLPGGDQTIERKSGRAHGVNKKLGRSGSLTTSLLSNFLLTPGACPLVQSLPGIGKEMAAMQTTGWWLGGSDHG